MHRKISERYDFTNFWALPDRSPRQDPARTDSQPSWLPWQERAMPITSVQNRKAPSKRPDAWWIVRRDLVGCEHGGSPLNDARSRAILRGVAQCVAVIPWRTRRRCPGEQRPDCAHREGRTPGRRQSRAWVSFPQPREPPSEEPPSPSKPTSGSCRRQVTDRAGTG